MSSTRTNRLNTILLAGSIVVALFPGKYGLADGGVTFTDIAANGGAGITYHRVASARDAALQAVKDTGFLEITEFFDLPLKSRGAPGVAIFDYDRDGDLDLYVTNGPGADNALYSSQLEETGQLSYIDVASGAGVAANTKDSNGTCFGDIDNDGDHDLLVLNFNEPHSLFENQGDGTFTDISAQSQIVALEGAMSCSMGDVDGDGLLDIAIANLSNIENLQAFGLDPINLNTPNQLYINAGNNTFIDVSTTSGIRELDAVPAGAATLSWAVAVVDYDLDGDQDIVFADDQAGFPGAVEGGVDRGYIQLLENDGNANFTAMALGTIGEWMGLSFGDLNCDGQMDIFGSNFGDYGLIPNGDYSLGDSASRWFLGQGDGAFSDPEVGRLVATPFGWGTSVFDYDNDADGDIVFHGGMDLIMTVDQTNAGVLLQNQNCSADFVRDTDALTVDHGLRNVQGAAVGDLNNDGFVDIVSVSSFDTSDTFPRVSYGVAYGSVFDADAVFVPAFSPISETTFAWNGLIFPDGTLSVEINSADNGNRWAAVQVLGTIGIATDSVVNRDGIGAVVTFTPKHGTPSMQPVLGGSSYASQDSLTAHFGLGRANKGVVDVLWPGGVGNRLYNVRRGETVTFPEIPCSYDADWSSRGEYVSCLKGALLELVYADVLTWRESARFFWSGVRAYYSVH